MSWNEINVGIRKTNHKYVNLLLSSPIVCKFPVPISSMKYTRIFIDWAEAIV